MRKKLLIISFALLVSSMLVAQISLGPRVGISSSKVSVDERFNYNGEQVSYKTEGSRVGVHLGAFARIKISSIYLQPELLFTSAGGDIAVESDSRAKEVYNLTYNKLDVPVLLGVKVMKFVRLQAGPTFSLALSNGARKIDAFDEAKQNYNQATVGYQAGAGIDIGNLYIDLKYEGNLSKMGNTVELGNESFNTDMRCALIILAVGYNLF